MQGFQSAVHNQLSGLIHTLQLHHLITPKRLAYVLAGAFLLVSAALLAVGGTAGHRSASQQLQRSETPSSSGDTAASASDPSSGSTTHFSSTTTNGSTSTSLNVNGQDIAMPANGSTHQTMTGADGSRTTIDASHSSSESVSNSSSSSVRIDVESNSSTEGSSP